MNDELNPKNARTSPRLRTLKAARIVLVDGSSSFDVTIKDLSDSGARLKLNTTFIVPPTFQLLIINPNTGKSERRACETRWQRGDVIGAKFVGPEVGAPDSEGSLRRRPVPPA